MRVTLIVCVLLLTMAGAVYAAQPCLETDCTVATSGCETACTAVRCGGCDSPCRIRCTPAPRCGCTPAPRCHPRPELRCCDDPLTKGFTAVPLPAENSALPPADCCLQSDYDLIRQVCWDLEYSYCCRASQYELLCDPCRECPSACRPKCRMDTCTSAPRCECTDTTNGIDIG